MDASGTLCPRCGAQNKSRDPFCASCGARLAAAPPPPTGPEPLPEPAYEAPNRPSNLPLLVTMGVVLLLLLLVVIEGVIILLPQRVFQEVGATLLTVDGKIFVQSGGEGDWVEVAEQHIIQAGDRIRVAGASQALLTFLEGTATELRPFTEVTVAELELLEGQPVLISLDLQLGEMWNRIGSLPPDSWHEVSTTAARIVSHGREYGVAVNDPGTTWLTGHEGEIDVTGAGQTVILGPGDMLVVEPGSAPVPYEEVAMAPSPPVQWPIDSLDDTLEGVDLPTFLNEPFPTNTPTPAREATHTPTATSTATPTATATRVNCPTLIINAPSTARPRGVFGMEWDAIGAPIPAGWGFALEFSQDPSPQAAWQRAQPDRIYQEGGHWKAELHGPGPGHWYWRVCLVSEPTAPSQCCGEPHTIDHQGDEEPEPRDEPEEPVPLPYD